TNPIRSEMSPISSATSWGSSSGDGTGIHAVGVLLLFDMVGLLRTRSSRLPLDCIQEPLVFLDVDLSARQAVGEHVLRCVAFGDGLPPVAGGAAPAALSGPRPH